jgi:hypothetical protein
MFSKKQAPKQSSKEHAPDAGRLSLWANNGSGTHVASGTIILVDEDGVETQFKVFMYENSNKKSDSSPDYFGFIKQGKAPVEETEEEVEEAPAPKRAATRKSTKTEW